MPTLSVLFLVQTRRGSFEFFLSPERLNGEGVVFVCRQPLGHMEERLLLDICVSGGASTDAIDIVAAVAGHIPGVGTRVRFCWPESPPGNRDRFGRYLEQLSVLKPGDDYPLLAFAFGVKSRAA